MRPKMETAVVQVDGSLRELVTRFLARKRSDVARIRRALQLGDFDAIRATGHDLKGAGMGYGFAQITSFGENLELAAEAHDRRAVRERVGALERYLSSVRVEFV